MVSYELFTLFHLMILSRTGQYAIQALIVLAMRPRGEPVLNRELAQHLNVPPAYLAKVLQSLGKGNLLYSFRGRHGGFCLREGGEKTDLMRILLLTEGEEFAQNCVLGLKECGDDTACLMHCEWKTIKQDIVYFLHQQTLEKMAESLRSGKYKLADMPLALISTAYSDNSDSE